MSTSRVGRKPVAIPSGVDVQVQERVLAVKGPKGQLTLDLNPYIEVEFDSGLMKFTTNPKAKYTRSGSGARLRNSIAGTTRSKVHNMIIGVTKGFERKLLLVGVGYRAQVKGSELTLTVGYSHTVTVTAPEGITIEAPTLTEILVKGADKHLVGHIASKIRDVRCPELYKGKGIRYHDEVIELKETKKK